MFIRFKKHIMTVETDKVTKRFAILATRQQTQGTVSFAVIAGAPEQLYAIRERTVGDHYWLSIVPINQNVDRKKIISGFALHVSNQKICKL